MSSMSDGPAPHDRLDRLILDARAGSVDALDALITHLSVHLWAELGNRRKPIGLGASRGLSDLVQDTLIRVRQRFARFERDTFSEFKQWSRAVLYRRQQEWIRNHKTRHSERNLQRIWDALSQNKTSDAASSLDSGLITAEQRAWLDEKLGQLKRHERFIIDLRVCHEMEFAEIADRTGLSPDAARMAFNRALARLRRIADA